MAYKVYVLRGTAVASSSETELDKITTPSGTTRDIKEVRVYTSQTSDVNVYLYKETDRLCEITAEGANLLKLPYVVTESIGAGTQLRLTASNSGASDSDVIVEVVVEEKTSA